MYLVPSCKTGSKRIQTIRIQFSTSIPNKLLEEINKIIVINVDSLKI